MEQLGDDDHLKESLHVCLLRCLCHLQPPLQQTTGKTRCVCVCTNLLTATDWVKAEYVE